MNAFKTLADLNPGESAYISSIEHNGSSCRLLALGLIPSAKVTFIRKSPLGDALYIKIDQHAIAIRLGEALSIRLTDV